MGCVAIGLTNSAFRLIGPLYAKEAGLGVTGIALFVSAGIVGGAVVSYRQIMEILASESSSGSGAGNGSD